MFLLIDNYDSFTYNLAQAFYALGQEPRVVMNDDPSLMDLAQDPNLELVCLSPGPGRPENAGLCQEFLQSLPQTIPVLGVCLGHQILGRMGGAEVVVAPVIMHGKQSEISHEPQGLFTGLAEKLSVGRYHSLVVRAEEGEPLPFRVTARGPLGEVMALEYTDRPWVGVQFHPESVLTPEGMKILGNFTSGAWRKKPKGLEMNVVLETLATGQDLTREMASFAFTRLMGGKLSPAQAGAFLSSLRMKGETFLELAEASRAALNVAVTIPEIPGPHIDVVGTGGDGRHSFNCSTATSLVLAGMGYQVTKHGNRAVSSTCGSADAIEDLGLPLASDAKEVMEGLALRNFAFLFAQNFHPAFKNIGPIRRELGIRTIFNTLGPLINPARPSHILLGVGHPDLLPLVAEALVELGQKRAAVVCGAGIYDEVTPIGPASILEIRDGQAKPLQLDPAELGIKPCTPADLEVHSRREAVSVLRQLLRGRGPGPMLDMIVLNVGLAIYLLEEDCDLASAMVLAREAVMAGRGRRVLDAA